MGTAEVKALLRNREFDRAIQAVDRWLAEFADSAELEALRRHAGERLAAERRLAWLAKLKSHYAKLA